MNKGLIASALCLTSMSGAWAAVYKLPGDGSTVVGTDSRISLSEDKLFDVARRYGIGYPEIVRANPGADIWKSGGTQEILLPVRRILPPTPQGSGLRAVKASLATRPIRPGTLDRQTQIDMGTRYWSAHAQPVICHPELLFFRDIVTMPLSVTGLPALV